MILGIFEIVHPLKIFITSLFAFSDFLDFHCLTFYPNALFHDMHKLFPIRLTF